MTELNELTLAQARDAIHAKKISATELTQAHIAAVENARSLGAFIVETPEQALDMAKASDARIAAGQAGPLEGLPRGMRQVRRGGHVIGDGYDVASAASLLMPSWTGPRPTSPLGLRGEGCAISA